MHLIFFFFFLSQLYYNTIDVKTANFSSINPTVAPTQPTQHPATLHPPAPTQPTQHPENHPRTRPRFSSEDINYCLYI